MVREIQINDIDISSISDGIYEGNFTYSNFTYTVQTTVKNHQIESINILSNRDTKHAKKAEGVITLVLEKQTPNVDAVTGATTTSKAILKAIENSLNRHNL